MRIKFCFLVLAMLVFAGCGELSVYVKTGIHFDKNAVIAISGGEDVTCTKGVMEHLLMLKGFNIVPRATVYGYKIDKPSIPKKVSSVYMIELDYSYCWNGFNWIYTGFSVKIIDKINDEIVATAYYRGKKSANAVIDELVDWIDVQVEEK